MLVDSKGNIIASTSYRNEYTTPFKEVEFEDGFTYSQIPAEISKRLPEGSGTLAYINNEKRILEYRPIDIRDWTVVVVSEDVSNTLMRNISTAVQVILTMKIYVVLQAKNKQL